MDEPAILSEAKTQKRLALFIRYQTTHDRAFHRALTDLLKLRAERRKQEIGFESQIQKQAQESRREAAEKRTQELHKWAVMLAEAKVDHANHALFRSRVNRELAQIAENRRLETQEAA